jgi:hypothetical protein
MERIMAARYISRFLKISIFLTAATLLWNCGASNNQGIKPYRKNPFYWEYHGEPVLLLGGTDDDNLFQWSGNKLTDHLDLLTSVGGNYVRNSMSDRNEGGEWGPAPEGVELVYAFERVGDRYDLSRWNDEYWRRLDDFLLQTCNRAIFVQLELWDAFDFTDVEPTEIATPLPLTWAPHPWNPKNNSNYSSAETGIPEIWHHFPSRQNHPLLLTVPTLNNVPAVLQYQERFIEKLLDITLPYDHVLYTIQNEVNLPHAWSDYWAAFIHRKARQQGITIQVTDMQDNWDLRNSRHQHVLDHPELYTYCDVSQNSHQSGQLQWDRLQMFRSKIKRSPRPINSVKMYVQSAREWKERNTEASAAEAIRGEAPARLWRNIFGGAASSRYHRPPLIYGLGLTNVAQTHIKSLRMLTDALHIFSMEPHNELLTDRDDNEAYAIAEPGRQYAVYFVNGGFANLDVSAVEGALRIQWLDIGNSAWGQVDQAEGSASVTLTAPGPGHWAVLLTPVGNR